MRHHLTRRAVLVVTLLLVLLGALWTALARSVPADDPEAAGTPDVVVALVAARA